MFYERTIQCTSKLCRIRTNKNDKVKKIPKQKVAYIKREKPIKCSGQTAGAILRLYYSQVNPSECRGNYIARWRVYHEVGTLAVDEWPVKCGTARRGLGGATARADSSSLYQM